MADSILFATDIHAGTGQLAHLPPASLLLLGGDLTHFGTPERAVQVVASCQARFAEVGAVSGNCDAPAADARLVAEGSGLHLAVRELCGLRICGIGGSNTTPAATPNEWADEDMGALLTAFAGSIGEGDRPLVVVTHAPPYGSGADRLPNGLEVGSRAVAAFVRTVQPALVLCGHIHEAMGVFDFAGIPVVNPGPLAQGYYAQIDATTLRPTLARLASTD
jgi:Icc-related predicted phosphoesterase